MKPTASIAALFNRSGSARDVVGAAAVPVVSREGGGSGAPSSSRLRAPLAVLALAIAAFAVTAASAAAAPLATTTPVISNVSYTSAHVSGELTTPGCGCLGGTNWSFQYSKDPFGEGWSLGPSGFLFSVAAENEPVFGDIEGLEAGAKYFVRLIASVSATETASPEPNPDFTTLTADPPTIPGAVEASPVFSTSAAVSGKVKRPVNSDDVNCHFDYVTDAQFLANEANSEPGFTGATPIDCAENPITPEKVDAGGEAKVTANLSSLAPGTTYHLRLVADNAAPGVVVKEAAATFTTEPTVAKAAVLKVNDAAGVSYKSATLSGEVQRPAGEDPALDVNCRFEYISDAQFVANEGNGESGFAGATPVDCDKTPVKSGDPSPTEVEAELTGLKSGATFHVRLTAENGGGIDSKEAPDAFTTTPGGDTTIALDPDLTMGYTSAQLSGTITRGVLNESQDQYYFVQYAEVGTENWSGLAFLTEVPGGPGPHNVTGQVDHLTPDTEYKFLLNVQVNGVPDPAAASFATGATKHLEAPTASCDPITGITGTAAHFSCAVDTHAPAGPLDELAKAAYKTDWHFECTPECPGPGLSGTVEGEEGSKAISVDSLRLESNTSYEVKLVAHNAFYSVETVPQSFNTPLIAPTVKATPGGSDGHGGYTLQGVVNPNHSPITACEFKWGPNSASYAFSTPCSPSPGSGGNPVTVEAHLTGLTSGATYHALLVIESDAFGKADGGDQTFVPTLISSVPCPNEELRAENNSLALPECRAFEQVSSPNKLSQPTRQADYFEGNSVAYSSSASNIANSGQGSPVIQNYYVANRTEAGWKTIPDLNGPTGSPYVGPDGLGSNEPLIQSYSTNLQSSLWWTPLGAESSRQYLRNPNGSFTVIGGSGLGDGGPAPGFIAYLDVLVGASSDLSHVVVNGASGAAFGMIYGPGLYEFVGTGNERPGRVDVDNAGNPLSACGANNFLGTPVAFALGDALSNDGRVIVMTANGLKGGCAGNDASPSGPPADELWVRVGGTSYEASASLCARTAGAPGGACNAPADAKFQGAAEDGSRVYFTTTQQLVNADTDQTNDLYACDIPSGSPAPVGVANPCGSLTEVSGPAPDARVERVTSVSEDGSTVYFVAQGALASNEDAFGETAVVGDHNLYVWRKDDAHPAGETKFVARLDSNDLSSAQTTPDGRYLAFLTANQLVPTDTDNARDVYRFDADADEMVRVSTDVFGVGGNADGFDAAIDAGTSASGDAASVSQHHSHPSISDDGSSIVFSTAEPLSAADGNGEPDIYIWNAGHVYPISAGSAGGGGVRPFISGSGRDIYFSTAQALTPSDGDRASDIYDARVDGGFSFAEPNICKGEACQGSVPAPPVPKPIDSTHPDGTGNVTPPKPCPKPKVRRHGRCVKKSSKKPHKKSGKRNVRRTGHDQGDSA